MFDTNQILQVKTISGVHKELLNSIMIPSGRVATLTD